MNLNILHTGDWHVRDKDIEECRKVLNAICDEAIRRKHELDLIEIAGDLTDRNDVKPDSQTARLVISTVSRLSYAAPVVITKGTKFHDGNIPELLDGTHIRAHHSVIVSTRPEQFVLASDNEFYPLGEAVDGKLLVSTVPTPTKQYFDSLSGIEETDLAIGRAMTGIFANMGMEATNRGLPHALSGHWQAGGAYVSETQQLVGRDIEISVDQIHLARPTVTCLGHIHMAQQIGSHPVFYCGSSYRKDFGEMEAKGFWIHAISEAGHEQSEWVELPTRKLVRAGHDYTADNATDPGNAIDPVSDQVAEQWQPEEIENAHVRLEFKIWQDQRDQINKAELEQQLMEMGATAAEVKIVPVPRQNVRAQQVLEAEQLRDKIIARAEIIGDTVSESILAKCDALEAESAERIMEKLKQAA